QPVEKVLDTCGIVGPLDHLPAVMEDKDFPMALGRRPSEQQELWIATTDLPRSAGHPFYEQLNRLLADADFDHVVETLCAPHYAQVMGRPSIPPGVYFRMLVVGYFEGIDSQRGIAWRVSDSLSLRAFLGIPVTESTPDHSSLTRTRKRLPIEVHEAVFVKVLQIAQQHELLKGKTVGVDATTLEANAAMKSIVRKDTGEDWQAYLTRLAKEAGIEDPTSADLKAFDRKRTDKKVSNIEWESPTDKDSRITKMKDGTTHLAYKAEHVVDLDTEIILAATIQPGDRGDTDSLPESLVTAQMNLMAVGSEQAISELAADKGYHKAETVAQCEGWCIRTYIPEPKAKGKRRWTDKPAGWREAVYANRRRVRGAHGKQLGRRRRERVERSFAHVCETGGGRRTWLRGLVNVAKRYVIQAAARNLGLIMRAACGIGKPRTLQGSCGAYLLLHVTIVWAWHRAIQPSTHQVASRDRSWSPAHWSATSLVAA
ncbi:MAG: transposase, partial [Anaerolineae bacterium]|nr:transposase [Anaerolineae bacterium]